MSGHSKWSTIKRQKGTADIKRGLTFTKIANAITIASRVGRSSDPNSNPRLRAALESARRVNMPKENISRAIDRGLGKLPGQILEEVYFEGFGPGKVAYFIEGVTDNRMRTLQEVKHLFEKSGGSLGGSGSTSYLFEKKGEIKVKGKGGDRGAETFELIDLGAEEVEDFIEGVQKYLVYVSINDLGNMGNKIVQSGFEVEGSEVVYQPSTVVKLEDQSLTSRVIEFTNQIEELDDIQKVYANFDITDNLSL